MKNLTKKILLSMAIFSAVHIASAQQFPPQAVLDDLTATQIKQIKALGPIPNKDVTSPVYDFQLSRILTPAQAAKYNDLKDGERRPTRDINYEFNIDGN